MGGSAFVFEAQEYALPAAISTVCIIFSTVLGVFEVNKTRYKLKEFSHPYKPWDAKHADDRTYRAFKANQNQIEWSVYTVPAVWLFHVFSPSIPFIGIYLPWVGCAVGILYSHFNMQYVKAYSTDAAQRIGPFHRRTNCFKFLMFGAIFAIAITILRVAQVLPPSLNVYRLH